MSLSYSSLVGGAKKKKAKGGKRKTVRVHGYTRARRGGAAAAALDMNAPIYGRAGGEYFQDYAQVAGHDASAYGYADPRIAGAYDMYADPRVAGASYDNYGLPDPRYAGAEAYYDPRYAGAVVPQPDPYAEWAHARYAGAVDPFQAPLIGGDTMDAALVGGAKKKKKRGPTKGKHLVRAHKQRIPHSSHSHNIPAHMAAKPMRRGRRGGEVEMPLIGGYDAPAFYPPLTAGYAFEHDALVGGKHHKRRSSGRTKRRSSGRR
jgi:hypothetical protein